MTDSHQPAAEPGRTEERPADRIERRTVEDDAVGNGANTDDRRDADE